MDASQIAAAVQERNRHGRTLQINGSKFDGEVYMKPAGTVLQSGNGGRAPARVAESRPGMSGCQTWEPYVRGSEDEDR